MKTLVLLLSLITSSVSAFAETDSAANLTEQKCGSINLDKVETYKVSFNPDTFAVITEVITPGQFYRICMFDINTKKPYAYILAYDDVLISNEP